MIAHICMYDLKKNYENRLPVKIELLENFLL